jgi:hypothetical protein
MVGHPGFEAMMHQADERVTRCLPLICPFVGYSCKLEPGDLNTCSFKLCLAFQAHQSTFYINLMNEIDPSLLNYFSIEYT